MFAYSKREKTHAAYHMEDDVPEDVKLKRLQEVIDTFRRNIRSKNQQQELGKVVVVLVEGPSLKSTDSNPTLTGRTDGNKRVVFRNRAVLKGMSHLASQPEYLRKVREALVLLDQNISTDSSDEQRLASEGALINLFDSLPDECKDSSSLIGRYVAVKVTKASSPSLHGVGVCLTSLLETKETKGYLQI